MGNLSMENRPTVQNDEGTKAPESLKSTLRKTLKAEMLWVCGPFGDLGGVRDKVYL